MQLYACTSQGQMIRAHQALRQTDYFCLECQGSVRLRGGPQRQKHFYHLNPTPLCRQHQKGLIHLQLQSYFLEQLSTQDCCLELFFPTIRRIADVAWMSQKIIFEIQCSPIAASEVLARNRDYQREGWSVVWILHDQRYNRERLSAAEIALQSSAHFFSNMNRWGEGMIYDQFAICDKGLRLARLPPLPIQIGEGLLTSFSREQHYPLHLLAQRALHWQHSFKGDLMSLFLHDSSSAYLKQALLREKKFHPHSQRMGWQKIVAPYHLLFRFLLEKICR